MKKLLTITTLSMLTISSASASFYNECVYTAKVASVTDIATMNEPVFGSFRTGESNYSKLLELKLYDGRIQPGSHTRSCARTFTKVLAEKKMKYSVGDKLKVRITESNDRGGSFSYAIETK